MLALANQKDKRKITLSQIIDAVCFEYGITERKLVESGKRRGLAEARAISALLVQEQEHLSLTELTKRLHRDLSALSRAAGRIRQRLSEDPRLDERISSLRMKLK